MPSGRIRSAIHWRAPQAWMLRLAAGAAGIIAVGIAGCSGDDDESGPATFQRDTFPFTFEYPDGFEFSDDVSTSQELGGGSDESVGLAIDDHNGLFVHRYTVNTEVNQANLGLAKREFDELIQQVDPDASPGEAGELVGFPSLTYDAVTVPTPEDGESRLIVLFEGDQEYIINCQSTPDGREEVQQACDLAVETLARRS